VTDRPLSAHLRREAKKKERLADIADALEDGGLRVEGFSPLSDWVVVGRCDMCGCTLEAGACYCCNPVFGYGEGWHEVRHPGGISQEQAGTLGHPDIPLDEYLAAQESTE
jgi:hypothetical protein